MTTTSPRLFALVPCAGIGARAGTAAPKQYARVGERSVVAHALRSLAAVKRLDAVLVVLAPDDGQFESHVDGFGGERGWIARCGGATRAASVAAGLVELRRRGATATDWVLVHDAARCLIQPAWVDRLIDACLEDDVGGLLALPLADTLKSERDGRSVATLPRAQTWIAQTPQMFRVELLQRALARAGDAVTDEASAVESIGLAPRLVSGDSANIKVTWPADFAVAEALLAGR